MAAHHLSVSWRGLNVPRTHAPGAAMNRTVAGSVSNLFMLIPLRCHRGLAYLIMALFALSLTAQERPRPTPLPNGKVLADVPGRPRQTNNLPTAIALSPDSRFAVLLHSGYGAYTSGKKQSLSVLNLETDELADFPDDRLASEARQTYFVGLAFMASTCSPRWLHSRTRWADRKAVPATASRSMRLRMDGSQPNDFYPWLQESDCPGEKFAARNLER